jgi:hypothetical protein
VNLDLLLRYKAEFISTLTKLSQILEKADCKGQAEIASTIVDLLQNENFNEFLRLINGVDMWGGSGAVWEVYIEDPKDARDFETAIVRLIDIMEASGILGRGIKPIRKAFLGNLKS